MSMLNPLPQQLITSSADTQQGMAGVGGLV